MQNHRLCLHGAAGSSQAGTSTRALQSRAIEKALAALIGSIVRPETFSAFYRRIEMHIESPNARARRAFWIPLAISLLLHAVVLSIRLSSPGPASRQTTNKTAPSRLDVVISKPDQAVPKVLPKQPATPEKRLVQKKPSITVPQQTWSVAERKDMDDFLNELATEPRPPPAPTLSQRAMAMARAIGRQQEHEEDEADQQSTNARVVEPFSLQMYFDAFIRKMNQSAAFVKRETTTHGSHKALVQVILNPDGSLKSYRVIRASDQKAEIAYIKSVVDLAAPFSAFPSDIRNGMDSFAVLLCIFPGRAGEAGGGFSRSFGGQDCRD